MAADVIQTRYEEGTDSTEVATSVLACMAWIFMDVSCIVKLCVAANISLHLKVQIKIYVHCIQSTNPNT